MKIILASKSKVRKDILIKHNIDCEVIQSNIDEDPIKNSLIAEGATPEIISKNLAELKANKVSSNLYDELVLGADTVIDLNGKLIKEVSFENKQLLNLEIQEESGVYLLHINTDSKKAVFKLIKE